MGKRYPNEFRADIVAVARQGDLSLKQVAADFGVSQALVTNWMRQADIDEGRVDGVTSEAAQEMRALKKRNRTLEQEVEILRQATAYFERRVTPRNDVPARPRISCRSDPGHSDVPGPRILETGLLSMETMAILRS